MLGFLHGTAESLFATFFPSDCRLCQEPLTNISRLPVCQGCLLAMPRLEGSQCTCCGERLAPGQLQAEGGEPCPICRQEPPPFTRALAYGSYDGGLRELIHLLKFEGVRPAAAVLGRMLAEVVPVLLEDEPRREPVVLTPVPLHPIRQRQRGFNQAEQIARAAGRILLRQGTLATVEVGLLGRKKETRLQSGLTRQQRRANLRGAFAVESPEAVAGRVLVLVDDVFTTGATSAECAKVLLRCGAERVYVATVARTLRHDDAGLTFIDVEWKEEGEVEAPRVSAAHA